MPFASSTSPPPVRGGWDRRPSRPGQFPRPDARAGGGPAHPREGAGPARVGAADRPAPAHRRPRSRAELEAALRRRNAPTTSRPGPRPFRRGRHRRRRRLRRDARAVAAGGAVGWPPGAGRRAAEQGRRRETAHAALGEVDPETRRIAPGSSSRSGCARWPGRPRGADPPARGDARPQGLPARRSRVGWSARRSVTPRSTSGTEPGCAQRECRAPTHGGRSAERTMCLP